MKSSVLKHPLHRGRENCSLTSLKHGNDPDSWFDKKQLAAGTKVELEHTNKLCVAKKISKAHLSEFPSYYIALSKMEKGLKKK